MGAISIADPRMINLDMELTALQTAAIAAIRTTDVSGAVAESVAGKLGAGVIKSIQTGYVSNPAKTIGLASGEDYYYADVTVSSVNTAKCVVLLMPQPDDVTPFNAQMGTARLTSATNLRVMVGINNEMRGRYVIVEFY